jgi:transcription elongation GreA/GreB family factor
MTQKIELRRELGLVAVTLSGVGIILGAGIYVLIGKAAGLAGNAVWISFAFSALIAVLTGLSYAELSSLFPRASAEYEYTKRAFHDRIAFIVGWLVILSGLIGTSTVALGFGGYLGDLCGIQPLVSAVILIAALSLVIFCGIKESAWFAIISTLIEAVGLVFIIFIGIPFLGNVDYFEMPHGFKGVLEASALIFFAYIYITESDMNRLQGLLESGSKFGYRDKKHLIELEDELNRARVVPAKDIPGDVITMNSRVRLRDLDSGQEIVYSLVFPGDANLAENKISVLAPIGIALIGYRVGDTIEWKVPGGLKRLKVEEILYQPERAGDYNL